MIIKDSVVCRTISELSPYEVIGSGTEKTLRSVNMENISNKFPTNLNTNDRVLVTNVGTFNSIDTGIYTIISLGSPETCWELKIAPDSVELHTGDTVPVSFSKDYCCLTSKPNNFRREFIDCQYLNAWVLSESRILGLASETVDNTSNLVIQCVSENIVTTLPTPTNNVKKYFTLVNHRESDFSFICENILIEIGNFSTFYYDGNVWIATNYPNYIGDVDIKFFGTLPEYTITGEGLQKTLTANNNGYLGTQDEDDVQVGQTILLNNTVLNLDVGIYDIIQVGSETEPWVLKISPIFHTLLRHNKTVRVLNGKNTSNFFYNFREYLPQTWSINNYVSDILYYGNVPKTLETSEITGIYGKKAIIIEQTTENVSCTLEKIPLTINYLITIYNSVNSLYSIKAYNQNIDIGENATFRLSETEWSLVSYVGNRSALFTQNGTFVSPVRKVWITGCGGGSSGQTGYAASIFNMTSRGGNSGAASGWCRKYPITLNIGESYSVVIGLGGEAPSSNSGSLGNNGGNTTFASLTISGATAATDTSPAIGGQFPNPGANGQMGNIGIATLALPISYGGIGPNNPFGGVSLSGNPALLQAKAGITPSGYGSGGAGGSGSFNLGLSGSPAVGIKGGDGFLLLEW